MIAKEAQKQMGGAAVRLTRYLPKYGESALEHFGEDWC